TSRALGEKVLQEIGVQLESLPTAPVAGAAWANNGEVVVVESDDEAIEVADEYAPEHLEVLTARDDYYLANLRNYGSLFVGEESTVAYGDKGVGTNHTLPTGRAARYTGGLWVGKFIKDRKSTRLNSSHVKISYAVFCLKKKKTAQKTPRKPRLDPPPSTRALT